jgi:hypothetical protein
MKSAEEIKRQADALQSEYEGKRSKLYRGDGQKVYSDPEHNEQVRTLQRERNQKLDALGAEANTAMQEAEAESANIKSEDLSGRLTSEELANANARHAFVSEDVAEMPGRAIDARVDSVLAGGDRASMYLHARALRKRASESDTPTGAESAAKRLEDALFGEKRQGDIEAADSRAQEYLSAQLRASTLKRGATTPAGAWAAGLTRRAG